MAWTLTDDMLAAIQAANLRLLFFYEGNFKNGAVHWHTGVGPLVWNAITWDGFGDALKFGDFEETNDIKANGIIVSVAGVAPSKIALALAEPQRNKIGRVWLGLLTEAGAVIDSPKVIFQGRLDKMSIDDGGETASISVAYEHELITLERTKEVRYTDAEQQRLYPGDRGLEYVAKLQDAEIPWGDRG